MSLEALGNIGEFVGALAVVISLLYLAAQMRQNSPLVRASTYQSGADWTLAALTSASGTFPFLEFNGGCELAGTGSIPSSSDICKR